MTKSPNYWQRVLLCQALIVLFLFSCSNQPRFRTAKLTPNDKAEVPPETERSFAFKIQEGVASYYAHKFHGRTTSNGEIYNMYELTAAHKTLPFNTIVRVTNLDNGRSVEVRINDRGPFVKGRIIDLSLKAAESLGMIEKGTAPVKIEILKAGEQN